MPVSYRKLQILQENGGILSPKFARQIKYGAQLKNVKAMYYCRANGEIPQLFWLPFGGSYSAVTIPDNPTGRTYETIIINTDNNTDTSTRQGKMEWTIENLDYLPAGVDLGFWGYNYGQDNPDPKATYWNEDPDHYGWNGRRFNLMYTYTAAILAAADAGNGWRLPSKADWESLLNFADPVETAAVQKLKIEYGWATNNGTNDFRFNARPGASYSANGRQETGYIDKVVGFWSSTQSETQSSRAYRAAFADVPGSSLVPTVMRAHEKGDGFYVRLCRNVT